MEKPVLGDDEPAQFRLGEANRLQQAVAYYSRSTKWKRDAEVTLRIFRVEQFYGV